jgi:hypothetical protein
MALIESPEGILLCAVNQTVVLYSPAGEKERIIHPRLRPVEENPEPDSLLPTVAAGTATPVGTEGRVFNPLNDSPAGSDPRPCGKIAARPTKSRSFRHSEMNILHAP